MARVFDRETLHSLPPAVAFTSTNSTAYLLQEDINFLQ